MFFPHGVLPQKIVVFCPRYSEIKRRDGLLVFVTPPVGVRLRLGLGLTGRPGGLVGIRLTFCQPGFESGREWLFLTFVPVSGKRSIPEKLREKTTFDFVVDEG